MKKHPVGERLLRGPIMMKRCGRIDFSRVWLVAMLLLALALRVHHLDTQSLWYDEAVTAQVASQGISELTRWTADDIQPPLFYYVVAGWTRLAGRSEWALRFPAAFFGVLTVVLLWAAARRLFGKAEFGRSVAGYAALLSAVCPLYVYYAQEARMYTLLTFLGVLAGYALLRAAVDAGRKPDDRGQRSSDIRHPTPNIPHLSCWWALFVVASAAMLYTHYFGVFLLLSYGLCWLGWLIWGKLPTYPTRKSLLVTFVASAVAIILLYLPWLPAMLHRYRADVSYWQGSLKLIEALRHVAISFTVAAPEMMLEGDAVRLLPWFALALAAAVVALVLSGKRQGAGERIRALVCLFTCLLVPVLCVLFLASRTPKFNPRYLMLASPAYLLILAGGIAALGGRISGGAEEPGSNAPRTTHHAIRNTQYAARFALALALAGFLIVTSWVSIHNWFTDAVFTKAQWRELAAFVHQKQAPDEAVLLVSGHAYPAWDYYAADIPATRLPPTDILDVNAVLNFDVGANLAQALDGKRGVWLVTWQDEVVDPVGFVPYFLDRGGREQPINRQFWHVGLRHWQLAPDAVYPTEPQPQHADGANFDHKLALLGWDDPADDRITVYWRVLNTLQRDYQISVALEDGAGNEVRRWDGRPASYDYPATRWQPGQILFGRYPLSLSPGAPAGVFYVTLTIYDATDLTGLDIRDIADNPAGKSVRLGPMKLAPKIGLQQ